MQIRLLLLPTMWQKHMSSRVLPMRQKRQTFAVRPLAGKLRQKVLMAISLPAPSCATTVCPRTLASIPATRSSLPGTILTAGPFGKPMKSPTSHRFCKVSWISISPMALMSQSSPMATTPASTTKKLMTMLSMYSKVLPRHGVTPVLPSTKLRNGPTSSPKLRLRS